MGSHSKKHIVQGGPGGLPGDPGENTKSGAIDRALNHYAADLRNKEAFADQLNTETLERLSTG
jgi:hypothetical protein